MTSSKRRNDSLTLLAAMFAAGISCFVFFEHTQQTSTADAVLAVRTYNFDGSTRSRIETFLMAKEPRPTWLFTGQPTEKWGVFQVKLDVTESTQAQIYLFQVDSDGVQTANPAADGLVKQILSNSKSP